ncbi:PREDICTED: uncharacterized protein LOC105565862 [Vollenhovia emeryi]|uniref:uncharacterized protein LOC105565862 n=1 Tax=Vollenhovia emeryi TaxID=411798 RepID=UPI0005F3D47E|nr:PREDICTED: uncharacterized protein LOC105565862 [Vollenhovia emeryi]
MRSSLILGVALLLATAVPSVVQACHDQTCGNLGPGTNACNCGEVVVKAAKVQKPLFYASPEAINEAAVAREAVGRLSVGMGGWQTESVPSFTTRPCDSGAFSSSSSSSSSSGSFSSSSSSSSSSSVGFRGGLIGRKAYSPFRPVASGRVASNCGCDKTSESLQVRDLLSSNVEGKVVPSFPPIGDLCYPNVQRSGKFQVTTKVTPAYPGKIKCVPPIPYEVCVQVLNGQIDEAGLRELGYATGGKLSDYISRDAGRTTSLGGYRSYAGSRASSTGYDLAGYANSGAASYGYASAAAASADARASLAGSYGYSSEFNNVGDNTEFLEDYSYPRLPADPVSVTLAYKNLVPRTVYHNRRAFVPEDKLAFGHRTVPTESRPGNKVPDVPEEKLQILDKPVVELKPMTQTPINHVGVYDEHEEAKLAELEAIERERINQEEIAVQRENFITYGDLGYAPINQPTGMAYAAGSVGEFNAEDDIEPDCGPVGPPDPDYVPGSVVINQEVVEDDGEVVVDARTDVDGSKVYVRHYDDGSSDEQDDSDDSTSGIFARLKSAARKFGPPCGAV